MIGMEPPIEFSFTRGSHDGSLTLPRFHLLGVDYSAHFGAASFLQNASDVMCYRDVLRAAGPDRIRVDGSFSWCVRPSAFAGQAAMDNFGSRKHSNGRLCSRR